MGGMSPLDFLVNTLFDLYLIVVLLRIWLQLVRADFYNPLSQFTVRLTQPIIGPVRRILPNAGRLDSACLLLAIVVACLKVYLLAMLAGYYAPFVAVLVNGVMTVVQEVFTLLFWVLIIRALLSWVSQGYNPMEMALHQLTEPMLAPIRRVIPPVGGLDLSVLVLLIALQFLKMVLASAML